MSVGSEDGGPTEPRADEGSPAEARRALLAACVAALAIAVAELGYAALDRRLYQAHPLVMLRVSHALLCGFAILSLSVARVRPSTTTSIAWFYACIVPFVPIFWVADAVVIGGGHPWTPFVGHKYLMIGIALLAPGPLVLAIAAVFAFALEAVVFAIAFDLHARFEVAAGEPWPTILFAAIALLLVSHRARARTLEREIASARADSDAFEKLATLFAAARDQSNTRLQTLTLALQVLRMQHPERGELLDRMQRAIDELAALNRTIARCDEYVRSAETSFDARARLEELERTWRRAAVRRR